MTNLQKSPSAGVWLGPVFLAAALLAFFVLPGTPLDKFYLVCFGICPQRASHSYFMGGQPLPGEAALLQAIPALERLYPAQATKMPLEARMYGMFAGFMVTWLYTLARGRRRAAQMPPAWLMLFYLSFIAVMGVDGINATLYDLAGMGLGVPYAYAPVLEVRLATGLLCGIAIAGIVLPIANYMLWRDARPEPLFANFFELVPLLFVTALLFFLVVSRVGWLFYPLSLLGVLGVIATVVSINLVVVLSLVRREGAAQSWFQAMSPIAVALLCAMLELGALSLLRFAAFGLGEIP